MIKSINMHKNTDRHEFENLGEALLFFATDGKIKFLERYEVVDGMTQAGTKTKERVLIGLYNTNPVFGEDVPDDVIILETQD